MSLFIFPHLFPLAGFSRAGLKVTAIFSKYTTESLLCQGNIFLDFGILGGYTLLEGLIFTFMQKSMTVIEVITIIIIVGLLAVIAFSKSDDFVEGYRGKEAEENLDLIHNAEKRYALANAGAYFICAAAGGSPSCREQMKQKTGLGLEITGSRFNYTITTTSAKRTDFTATATRKNDGPCAGKTMSITQDGGAVQKGCSVW
ncbi:MAG: hypothetical protein WC321_02445 [Candidatus Omnitrophota bacterium]|jgi:Tfp pilus assembly protein PilE